MTPKKHSATPIDQCFSHHQRSFILQWMGIKTEIDKWTMYREGEPLEDCYEWDVFIKPSPL